LTETSVIGKVIPGEEVYKNRKVKILKKKALKLSDEIGLKEKY